MNARTHAPPVAGAEAEGCVGGTLEVLAGVSEEIGATGTRAGSGVTQAWRWVGGRVGRRGWEKGREKGAGGGRRVGGRRGWGREKGGGRRGERGRGRVRGGVREGVRGEGRGCINVLMEGR